jgi:hypothetical protein
MQCPRCQADNREGRRFCAECGASLALPCAACGFSNEPGEKFCGGCGLPLTSVPRTPEPRLSSPQSYTPEHLAEQVLASRAAVEGERKQVTAFSTNIMASSTSIQSRWIPPTPTIAAPRIAADAFHRLRTIMRQSFDQCRPQVDRHVPAVRGA